ncbi:hypothetical protein ON010_g9191 [Phytophthora cinnamomi]|nr:hypothetical protein ON010_g9191 [Phytophthora cinnamomi]
MAPTMIAIDVGTRKTPTINAVASPTAALAFECTALSHNKKKEATIRPVADAFTPDRKIFKLLLLRTRSQSGSNPKKRTMPGPNKPVLATIAPGIP